MKPGSEEGGKEHCLPHIANSPTRHRYNLFLSIYIYRINDTQKRTMDEISIQREIFCFFLFTVNANWVAWLTAKLASFSD